MNLVVQGALVSGTLIAAIGAQNAYVLRQGLLDRYVPAVAFTCFLCDALLMTLGVFGVGQGIQARPLLAKAIALAGAAFLAWYGMRSFISAFSSTRVLDASAHEGGTLRTAVLGTLGVTLLNPHVYLDTVVIVGGIAGALTTTGKQQFLTGALSASFVWFFGLGLGARLLQPWFRRPGAWRLLEFLIGCTMWWIGTGLAWHAWRTPPHHAHTAAANAAPSSTIIMWPTPRSST